MKMKFFIPMGIFFLLVILLYKGLSLDPKKIPSPFIDKPVPQYSTSTLYGDGDITTSNDFEGEVWVLNVFASWCVSCRAEHKVVTRFANETGISIVGLNYKDEASDAKQWLSYFGNPYTVVALDRKGKIGLEFGVYGVPESFVIDKKGIIRYKQIGPLTDEALDTIVLPLIEKLRKEKR
jgi:cytochrome c biogenesis protein CcmG/thiol:disulfide interchange protein DsbE